MVEKCNPLKVENKIHLSIFMAVFWVKHLFIYLFVCMNALFQAYDL